MAYLDLSHSAGEAARFGAPAGALCVVGGHIGGLGSPVGELAVPWEVSDRQLVCLRMPAVGARTPSQGLSILIGRGRTSGVSYLHTLHDPSHFQQL